MTGTPSSRWHEKGEPDPHGDRYNCERAGLAFGHMTDDELANAVFLHNHRNFDFDAIMRGEPSSIALLTAAKDRIRWLSRKVEQLSTPTTDDVRRQARADVSAAQDVLTERKRQIEAEGWTSEHDDGHADGELAKAAVAYAHYGSLGKNGRGLSRGLTPIKWPWDASWWKPTNPRADLVKAGALIIAEIERLDRAAAKAEEAQS